MKIQSLPEFLKAKRKEVGLTQEQFAIKSGIALTVIRQIEQGKTNVHMDKVNHLLLMFGHELAPVEIRELEKLNFSLHLLLQCKITNSLFYL